MKTKKKDYNREEARKEWKVVMNKYVEFFNKPDNELTPKQLGARKYLENSYPGYKNSHDVILKENSKIFY